MDLQATALSSLVARAGQGWPRGRPLPIGSRRITATLLAGLFALAALLPTAARAQGTVSLASLEIALWPEFDKPSVLVIMNGQVAAGVVLPASLSIHIPAAASAPNAVAVVAADGGLFQTPYTTSSAGGDIIITFTTNSAGFRVEYYDPSLAINGEARSFGLRWKSDIAIQAVTVRVQQPYGARSLSGRPALVSAGPGEYGLNEYTAALGPLAAGGTVSFDLGYSKTGNGLSATAVANSPSGASAQAASGIPGGNGWPWLVGGGAAALALAGGGAVWYWRLRPAAQAQARRRPRATGQGRRETAPPAHAAQGRRRPATARARAKADAATTTASRAADTAGAALETAPAAFCPQCGRRYQSGDRFCRQCGAPVRT
jgi:zinc-ribbon domain